MADAQRFSTFDDLAAALGRPRHGKPCSLKRFLRLTEAEPWREVLRRDPCAFCGEAGGTIDHIEATSVGGANNADNLTGACARCNSRKGSQSLLEFLGGVFRFADPQPVRSDRLIYSAAFARGRVRGRRHRATPRGRDLAAA